MPRFRVGSAGAILAAALAGCGDTGVQSGPVPFQGTGTDQFKGLTNEMKKNEQTQAAAATAARQPGSEAQSGVPAAAQGASPALPAGAAQPKPAEAQSGVPAAAQGASPALPAGAAQPGPAGPQTPGAAQPATPKPK